MPAGLVAASFGARAWAATVDLVVRLLVIAVLVVAGAIADAVLGTGDVLLVIGFVVGLIAAQLVYAPWMMSARNGQTLGHRAASIRVVHRTGAPIHGGRAFVREVLVKSALFEWVAGAFLIPLLLNYLWPLWDARNEALHDKMCDTLVVRA